eukprot:CAMPEP_0182564104 /NCGR_PEP_ID=MMETSP1324-20130603/6110_1 /TAXON_ID=236786 /ORGANISM="Florenciella sp., Strain RCC1587" /LENGTH=47 /DNA_ID= /DNA_START= /DNA_END= /DNA_ORIENTATION=
MTELVRRAACLGRREWCVTAATATAKVTEALGPQAVQTVVATSPPPA